VPSKGGKVFNDALGQIKYDVRLSKTTDSGSWTAGGEYTTYLFV
jgi:hypothetical protein